MKFKIDKQTSFDLELFERAKGEKSIFALFNHTQSKGGYEKLKETFSNPKSDITLLKDRVDLLKHFDSNPIPFEIDKTTLDIIEYYLIQDKKPIKLSLFDIIRKSIDSKLKPTNKSYIIQRGIEYLVGTINDLYVFANQIEDNCNTNILLGYKNTILGSIEKTNLKITLGIKDKKRFNSILLGKLDYYFRYSEYERVRELLNIIYEIDMFKSISYSKQNLKLVFPKYASTDNQINIKGLYHPFLDKPVANDLHIDNHKNICFVTGPNMAGKSTYLKSFGIAIYLSHVGFPIPAQEMETSIFNGLFSSINLSDSINKGYSHYYNEVIRIKQIAEHINEQKNLVVIFDELFRGTNVKDAYDASLAVISAFARIENSAFAISTHITEVAENLKFDSIDFKYFDISFENGIPSYTFSLKSGVTNERLGLYILQKEKVIETIENAISQKTISSSPQQN